MTAPQTRRAILSIGLGGIGALILGCPVSPSKRSGSSAGATGSPPGRDTADSGGPPTDSGGKDTASSRDTAQTRDTSGPVECTETSPNIEGPFWIPGVPERSDLDLYGDEGVSLTISGLVLDTDCNPIPDAIVEVWQANPSGAYDNTSAEMRYRGQLAANERGEYSFHTLRPGLYLNGSRYRPSHIHIKIWVKGEVKKTTQLYFAGDPHLEGDAFVVDDLIIPLSGSEETALTGSFDFVVQD